MSLTMAAVAANKGIAAARLDVTVEGRTEFVGRETRTRFISRIELRGNPTEGEGLTAGEGLSPCEGLTPREVRILYNAARSCEVHKMLRGQIEFEDSLV